MAGRFLEPERVDRMRKALIVCTMLATLGVSACGDIDKENIQKVETFVLKVMNNDPSACDMMIRVDKKLCLDRMEKKKRFKEKQAKELESFDIKKLHLYSGDENLRTYKGQLLVKLKNGKSTTLPIDITLRNIDGTWKIQDK